MGVDGVVGRDREGGTCDIEATHMYSAPAMLLLPNIKPTRLPDLKLWLKASRLEEISPLLWTFLFAASLTPVNPLSSHDALNLPGYSLSHHKSAC